jgi:hypothetical protein
MSLDPKSRTVRNRKSPPFATNAKDGPARRGSVALDADGNIFGTAAKAGRNNQGVAFEITP